MLQIVVLNIPPPDLFAQVFRRSESRAVVQSFLIGSVRAFDRTVLRRFARIDEVVDDTVLCTELLERMQRLRRLGVAFVGAEVEVGEDAACARSILCRER